MRSFWIQSNPPAGRQRIQFDSSQPTGDIEMFKNSDNDSNTGNDGFVWSQRLTIAAGFIFALAVAVARFAPILAAPLEWGH
jgi:hypothetical protein